MRILSIAIVAALFAVNCASGQQRFALSSSPALAEVTSASGRLLSIRIDAKNSVHRAFAGETEITFDDGREAIAYTVDGTVVGIGASDAGNLAVVAASSDVAGGKAGGWQLELLEPNRGVRYRIPLPRVSDDPLPGVSVGDDGSATILHHAQGSITFISPTGAVVAQVQLSSGPHDIERTILASRSTATGRIAVAVNEPVIDGVRSVSARRVDLFTSSGRRLGGFDIPRHTVSALAISGDGNQIVVGAYDVPDGIFRTYFFDESGRELLQSDFAAERIEFDAEGSRVLISNKRRAAIVEPATARILLDYRMQSSDEVVLSTSLSADGSFAAGIAGATTFRDGRFVHDDIRILEFVAGPTGDFTSQSMELDESAVAAYADVQASGLAIGIDNKVLTFRRP